LERLVKNSDQKADFVPAAEFLRKLLEEMEIPLSLGGVIEKLAHFIDDHKQATRALGGFSRASMKDVEQFPWTFGVEFFFECPRDLALEELFQRRAQRQGDGAPAAPDAQA